MKGQDIAPELLEKIKKDFMQMLGDASVKQQDYIGAAAYADKVGEALARAFGENLSSEILPDGKMYWNIADRVVRPLMEEDHRLVSEATAAVQQLLNDKAGIGIKVQKAELDIDRVEGILNKISAADQYDDVAWVLDEPVKTFSRSVVDETLRKNVDFQGKAGLSPVIIRRAESHACEWCGKLAGIYNYPDVPKDVYRRHGRCRCTVEYDPKNGKRQDVWTKKWGRADQNGEIQGLDISSRVREVTSKENPVKNVMAEYLKSAKPGTGSIHYGAGYNKASHIEEVKIAQWLHDELGGDIELLQEIGGLNQKTPDYIWRGKYWELKSISTEKAADSAVRKALKQIVDNPGGIVLDCSDHDMSQGKLVDIITRRIQRQNCEADILIIHKNMLVKALRHKK